MAYYTKHYYNAENIDLIKVRSLCLHYFNIMYI
jgi:hypothetical protein